jgi:hypothetical protein
MTAQPTVESEDARILGTNSVVLVCRHRQNRERAVKLVVQMIAR